MCKGDDACVVLMNYVNHILTEEKKWHSIVMCKKAHAWSKHHVLPHVTLPSSQLSRIL